MSCGGRARALRFGRKCTSQTEKTRLPFLLTLSLGDLSHGTLPSRRLGPHSGFLHEAVHVSTHGTA